jgi:putative ABC transport system permease protein
MTMMSGQFARTLLIGSSLAAFASFFLARKWLEAFSYRIDLSPGIFGEGTTLVFIVALLTVTTRTFLTARRNLWMSSTTNEIKVWDGAFNAIPG